jgi:hypothetical protein
MKMGYAGRGVCSAPRELPATHFDRNESHIIPRTGHSVQTLKAWLNLRTK